MDIDRNTAVALLKKYNQNPFHLRHAWTVEAVMRYFAKANGYADEAEFWGIAGLLHDIDFEKFPEEHCKKAPELLAEINTSERLVHAVCSHGWNLTVDVAPEHFMEKVLYATDELTGLIWACSIMLPSKSVKDLQLKTIRKKFRNEQFAAGCSRHVIAVGAELLGWTLDELFERTLVAMQETEEAVEALSNG
ncbi:MAG: hydrolase [Victivallales bacterium]|jgi:predicted hydrolase (HD superfamily)|nr:hydrolase [Victivallales bacterium]